VIHPSRWGDKSAQQFTKSEGDYNYSPTLGMTRDRDTVGWHPTCRCGEHGETDVSSGRNATPLSTPCTVLDPFMGSGTVALVARKLGRKSIGIELNAEYAELCARRLQQQSLFACVVDESAGLKDTVG
jgi:hypothetical protein